METDNMPPGIRDQLSERQDKREMSKMKAVKVFLLYFLAVIVILGRVGNVMEAHGALGVLDAVMKVYWPSNFEALGANLESLGEYLIVFFAIRHASGHTHTPREMGFRFRKGLRLFPGLRLNISKSGFSLSIGKAPFTINLGKKGVMGTTSLPGSGISYRSKTTLKG